MPDSPTRRTLLQCRKNGWLAHVVEKWIPQTHRRSDVFGFGDVLALDDKPGSLLIQATSDNTGGSATARVQKICGPCRESAHRWIKAGNRVEVWAWGKRGAAGKRKLWRLRVIPISVDMVEGEAVDP